MRTIIIILAGFALLAGCIAIARLIGTNSSASMGVAVRIFIAIWFVVAAVNMWIGVARAGYSFTAC